MPELPEVETTRRGLEPWLIGRTIQSVEAHETRLRWPFDVDWVEALAGSRILRLERRAKYLLMTLDRGTLLMHLGMSGSLRLVTPETPRKPHDHLCWQLDSGQQLRFHDPRRFGCVLLIEDVRNHPLLRHLGPEPLGPDFTGARLHEGARGRQTTVKSYLMDQQQVVGVGNIYASEALFKAGIHPARAAGRISRARYDRLATTIRETLQAAIDCGGTTLRDFVGGDGNPGYFQQTLQVYGRTGEPCRHCGTPIASRVIAQRNTFFCPRCQH